MTTSYLLSTNSTGLTSAPVINPLGPTLVPSELGPPPQLFPTHSCSSCCHSTHQLNQVDCYRFNVITFARLVAWPPHSCSLIKPTHSTLIAIIIIIQLEGTLGCLLLKPLCLVVIILVIVSRTLLSIRAVTNHMS